MADEKDLIEETKQAARDAVESPMASAIQKIAEHSVAAENRTNERLKALERKTQTDHDAVIATVTDTSAHLSDRLDALGRGGLNGAMSRFEDITSDLKAVMTDEQKRDMSTAKQAADHFRRTQGADSELTKPEVVTLAGEWFQKATLIQSPRFAHKSQLGERLDKITAAFNGSVSKAALDETSNSEGGYLVPTIVAGEILRQVLDAGDIFPRARPWPMTTHVVNVPNEATACSVNWIAEFQTLTAGEPTFGQTTLTADKLAGRATMSIEVVQDSAVALLPYLLGIFTEAMARELDKELVIGDGSTPAITGITNASGVVAITSGTAAGRALTYSLLVQAYLGASQKSSRQGAAWIMSKAGHQEILELTDGNGRPLLKLDNLDMAPSGTLFGSPIIVNSALGGSATLDDTTNSNTTICYGPLSSLIGATRQGMTWDVTDQVNWATYQMDARLIGRFGGAVSVPKDFVKLTHITTA